MKLKRCFVSLSVLLYQSQSALQGMCNSVWDGFRMADKQLSYNYCWFSSMQSVYTASNEQKKKCKS